MGKPQGTGLLWTWVLLLVVASAGNASAQHHLSGEVGADLGLYSFRNNIFAEDFNYDSDRRMSNQYLDLDARGPLGTGYFARYQALARLRSTQIRSEADGNTTTDHLGPDVTHYHGELSFFPGRAFPLKVYTGRSEENTVRYEPGNRSQIDQVDPGLSVVRRYATIAKETGAQWRWAVKPDLEVGSEIKQTHNSLERQYDFDENRNIWVDFLSISPGVSPYYNISVVNTIPDHDMLVYIDFAFADTVKAGSSVDLVIEEGARDIDLVPVGNLNSYSTRLNISSDMQWKIFFNDPPGAKDLDQANDIVTARLKYGTDGSSLQNDTYFEYNNGDENVQDMTTALRNFNNVANYNFSRNASINSLTTYTSNLTDVGVVSHQQSNLFMQQTTGKWSRPRGIATSLNHSISKMSSDTGADEVKSTNNILTGLVLLPTRWHQHEVSLRLNGNFLSDNKGFVNNLVSAELGNRLEMHKLGFRWRPKHTFKTTKSEGKNPDGSNSELDSKLVLSGDSRRVGLLGAVRIKGEYDWRRKTSETGIDTKNRYMGEIGITRKFTRVYKLMLTAGLDNELYNLTVDNPDVTIKPQQDDLRKTMRFDVQVAPARAFSLDAGGLWTSNNDSRTAKYSASVRLILPYISLPVRTIVLKERRELEGLRPQEMFQLETKVHYSFRKIRLELAHRLTDETLTTENYVYSEFLGKVTRAFDVY